MLKIRVKPLSLSCAYVTTRLLNKEIAPLISNRCHARVVMVSARRAARGYNYRNGLQRRHVECQTGRARYIVRIADDNRTVQQVNRLEGRVHVDRGRQPGCRTRISGGTDEVDAKGAYTSTRIAALPRTRLAKFRFCTFKKKPCACSART